MSAALEGEKIQKLLRSEPGLEALVWRATLGLNDECWVFFWSSRPFFHAVVMNYSVFVLFSGPD